MEFIKIIGLIIFLSFTSEMSRCQSQATNFTVGVILPDASNDFNQIQIQKLESKIIQILNNSNQVIVGYSNDFVVYPIISIEDVSIVEGGLQNITVATIDLSLFVKQVSSNLIYNTISKKVKGSGNSKVQAITNAISQIKTSDEGYIQFLAKAKAKIIQYYNDNCDLIIQKASDLASKKEFEQAISILQSIPTTAVTCYSKSEHKSLEIYKNYQTILCVQNITKAKAAMSINNYYAALEALQVIDPTSNCSLEVNKLIDQISSKVEKRVQRETDLEKLRINAMKEISKAYYSNTIRVIRYNYIIQ